MPPLESQQLSGHRPYGRCEGVGAWGIREGYYGETRMDGVHFVRAFSWPGAIHEGNAVRFEVKKPHGVAMCHENSYAQLSAFDWSTEVRSAD
jgi:hypothetical protein